MGQYLGRSGCANAACSRKGSVTRDSGNCVVADAVAFEPVSTLKNSLLTGKLTGNFSILGQIVAQRSPFGPMIQRT
jgi:hypothetical protein